MPFETKVQGRLTELLKEKGITQMELSNRSLVPQGSISRFDKNDRHSDWHVFAIAKALGVNVEELFTVTYQEKN